MQGFQAPNANPERLEQDFPLDNRSFGSITVFSKQLSRFSSRRDESPIDVVFRIRYLTVFNANRKTANRHRVVTGWRGDAIASTRTDIGIDTFGTDAVDQ